jgi:DNA-binding NarL/FixJ family response regulator
MNLVLCDAHRMFIDGLAIVFEARGWHVMARTGSIAEAAKALTTTDIDVCVLDPFFAGTSGVDGIADVLAVSPRTRVVVISAVADRQTVTDALASGASGFVSKTSSIDTIVNIIAKVASGGP